MSNVAEVVGVDDSHRDMAEPPSWFRLLCRTALCSGEALEASDKPSDNDPRLWQTQPDPARQNRGPDVP